MPGSRDADFQRQLIQRLEYPLPTDAIHLYLLLADCNRQESETAPAWFILKTRFAMIELRGVMYKPFIWADSLSEPLPLGIRSQTVSPVEYPQHVPPTRGENE